MAHTPPSGNIDPAELARAQAVWGGFVQASKYGIIGVVVILALLGLAFINW